MSLNQLALEMWERLGYSEIDPSVVSRVIKGERLFTSLQLDVFTKVLRLSAVEKEKLQQALYEDLGKRVGLPVKSTILEMAGDCLAKIEQIEGEGNPSLAEEWREGLYEQLKAELVETRDKGREKAILELLIKTLYSKVYLLQVTCPTNLMISRVQPIIIEAKTYIKALRARKYYSLDRLMTGSMYYCSGRGYRKALTNFSAAIRSHLGFPYRLHALQGTVLSAAYTGNVHFFQKANREIGRLMERLTGLTNSERCETLEEACRAKAVLKIDSWESDLEKAWQYYKTLNSSTDSVYLRKVQLARAEIEVTALAKSKFTRYIQDTGIEGIKVAQEHHYPRYAQKIWNLLNENL